MGVRCKDGVVLGFEKLIVSKMLVEGSSRRIMTVKKNSPATVDASSLSLVLTMSGLVIVRHDRGKYCTFQGLPPVADL